MPDEIQPNRPDDDSDDPRDDHKDVGDGSQGESGLPPELERMFENLTGGPVPPEMAGLMSNLGIDRMDPSVIQQAMEQVQSMMSGSGGGMLGGLFGADSGTGAPGAVDQDAARAAARAVVTGAAAVGRAVDEVEDSAARAVSEAVRIASLWVDEATNLPPHTAWAHAWTPLNWSEETLPLWTELVSPVAKGLAHAMSQASTSQLDRLTGGGDLPEELRGLLPPGMDASMVMGQVQGMLERMSAAMFSTQLGQAIGTLSQEVLTGSDVGLPLVPDDHIVLLPAAIDELAAGLSLDVAEVRLYLAVREVARTRLFAQVPWLGPQVLAVVRDYAADITFDLDAIESQLQGVDLQNPEALQSALSGSLFAPTPSKAQERALDRLETSLALIEGWVDVVAEEATAATLPEGAALAEALRRRRASGGPGEKVFRALVGLDLRPRRLRDAANLFKAMESAHGRSARDDVWEHPDMAPQSADLDDPLGYVERFGKQETDDFDAELAKLLGGQGGDAGSGDAGAGDAGSGDTDQG